MKHKISSFFLETIKMNEATIFKYYSDMSPTDFKKFARNYSKRNTKNQVRSIPDDRNDLKYKIWFGYVKGAKEVDWRYEEDDMKLSSDMTTKEIQQLINESFNPKENYKTRPQKYKFIQQIVKKIKNKNPDKHQYLIETIEQYRWKYGKLSEMTEMDFNNLFKDITEIIK